MICRETKSLKLAKLRGCTFVNQYVVIKYLGRGACGRVFLCMDMNDNRLYAVKVSHLIALRSTRNDAMPWHSLYTSVIRFYESCWTVLSLL